MLIDHLPKGSASRRVQRRHLFGLKKRCFLGLFSHSFASGSSSSFVPMEIDFSVYTDMCDQEGYDAHYEEYFR